MNSSALLTTTVELCNVYPRSTTVANAHAVVKDASHRTTRILIYVEMPQTLVDAREPKIYVVPLILYHK